MQPAAGSANVRAVAVTKAIELRTGIPGPRSKEILERKERAVADPLSIFLPIVIADAHGATLTDVDGNTFIDFTGGIGCLNVGHSHPQVVAAAQEQLEHFSHTDFTIVPYEVYVTLAERLCALSPIRGAAKAAFFNSGAEAVENAIKFARSYTGTARPDRVRGRLPRTHPAGDEPHLEDASLQGRPRAVRARGLPRAVPERLPRAERGRRARGSRARARHTGRGRDGRSDRPRAGAGRRRVHRGAARVRSGRAQDLRRERDRARRRRGADRLRAHREHVGDRPLGDRARPGHDREVDRRGPAALGRDRKGRDHGRARRLGDRRHLRRQPGRAGCGAGRPRRDRGGGPRRARGGDRRDDARAHARLAGALERDRRRARPRRDARDRDRGGPRDEEARARAREQGARRCDRARAC